MIVVGLSWGILNGIQDTKVMVETLVMLEVEIKEEDIEIGVVE